MFKRNAINLGSHQSLRILVASQFITAALVKSNKFPTMGSLKLSITETLVLLPFGIQGFWVAQWAVNWTELRKLHGKL